MKVLDLFFEWLGRILASQGFILHVTFMTNTDFFPRQGEDPLFHYVLGSIAFCEGFVAMMILFSLVEPRTHKMVTDDHPLSLPLMHLNFMPMIFLLSKT